MPTPTDKTLPAPIARGGNRLAHRGPRDDSDPDEGCLTAWTTAISRTTLAGQPTPPRAFASIRAGWGRALEQAKRCREYGRGEDDEDGPLYAGMGHPALCSDRGGGGSRACMPTLRARTITVRHALGPPRSPRATLRYYLVASMALDGRETAEWPQALPVITPIPSGSSKISIARYMRRWPYACARCGRDTPPRAAANPDPGPSAGWSGTGHHGPRSSLLCSLLKFVPSSVPLWIPYAAPVGVYLG
ncbi:hypothetical protein B0H10DRAFT_213547 [Mycena sp. CBHHK59/15]|nr:hypothetical protein B0H10DRAFT_213547 [Mycena sp. CBHHK59/15]